MITIGKPSVLLSAVAVFILTFAQSCKDDKITTDPVDQQKSSALFGETQTGNPIASGTINEFTFASVDDEVALVLANNASGKIFIVKLPDDSDASTADQNIVTQSLPDFGVNVAAAIGVNVNQLQLFDMQLNPLTRAIYILVGSTTSSDRSVLRVTNKGTQIEAVNLSDVEYAEVQFANANDRIFDLAWGDGSLYASYAVPSTLDGSVAEIEAPFSTGSAIKSRTTTVFKTNWGGGFHTNAPLETMTYVNINNEGRLAGVTTCAPGFSFPVSMIDDQSNLLEVNEYYNLNSRSPVKVFGAVNNGKTYLIEFHNTGRLTRIGEKYIDGQVADYNSKAKYILTGGGTQRAAGLTDEDVAILSAPGELVMITKFSENQAYAILPTGELKYDYTLF